MDPKQLQRRIDILTQYLTDRRQARIEEVLSQRTRNLALVLEDIYDPHNASACLRSAEAMGVQEVHVVAPTYPFEPSTAVTNGADKWLDIPQHPTSMACVDHLHERGFLVAAGALTPTAVPIQELPFERPLALVFGNEHEGLTKEMQQAADVVFHIPMLGFSQSFNISVATALSLHYAVNERIRRLGRTGDLTDDDKLALRARWYHLSVNMADEILRRAG